MKNKRIIIIIKKSRVDKEIRRIFNNKKRVNANFLKYVFLFYRFLRFFFFFFLTEFFKLRARFNRFNTVYNRLKTRKFFFIFEKNVTLKLLNILKVKSFTTIERVIKIEISFEFLFLRALLFSLKIFNEEFLKLKSFSS